MLPSKISRALTEPQRAFLDAFFAGCDEHFFSGVTLRTLPANRTLIGTDDTACSYVYILLKGRLQAIEERVGDEPYRFAELSAVEIVGDFELFTKADSRIVTLTTLTASLHPGCRLHRMDPSGRQCPVYPYPDTDPSARRTDHVRAPEFLSRQPHPPALLSAWRMQRRHRIPIQNPFHPPGDFQQARLLHPHYKPGNRIPSERRAVHAETRKNMDLRLTVPEDSATAAGMTHTILCCQISP